MSLQDWQIVEGSAGSHVAGPVDGSPWWDEHYWMLSFWSNSKAAIKRRRTTKEEFLSRMNKWIGEVEN